MPRTAFFSPSYAFRFWWRRNLPAVVFAVVAPMAVAQSGLVTGTVSNQATGELLPGATLEIEGTTVNGVTERGGTFSLTVPAGQRTLVVSFSGLDAARLPILVTAGQTIVREVQLTSEVYRMEKFPVGGEREGSAWVRNTTASWGGNSVGGTSVDPTVVAANVARAQRSFARRNTATGDYVNVFPGLHFVYEPWPGWLARASYNRAVSRPPVASLLPTVTENTETNTVSMGNPDLKPYFTDNFEVNVEKYFEPVGLFSVGAFLKEISNYSRSVSQTVPSGGIDGGGLYAGYTLTTTLNAGDARIRGLEASYQQQFSFLPGAWKGLGAFANYTYLQAEGTFGAVATTRKLGNLAPRSGNAGISFRYRGLDLRFLVNWTAEKYKSTNVNVDVYNQARLLLDFKAQYTISRRYDVFFDATNLTDEAARTDVALNGLKYFRTNQGLGFLAGVRGRF